MPKIIFCLFFVLYAGLTAAQENPATGYVAEVLRESEDAANKLISLAEAIPEEKYNWRPGEGVRSVREALIHIADANYFIPTMIGVSAPEGFEPGGLETKATNKTQVIEAVRNSFDHLRTAIQLAEEQDLEQETRWFGGSSNTVRGVLLFIPKHQAEHLGQLIAYARMNNVVPPWSQ